MRDKSTEPPLETGVYRHFKGELYTVEGVALDCGEGREDTWNVVYRTALGALCTRPYDQFVEVLFRDGKSFQRFVKQ